MPSHGIFSIRPRRWRHGAILLGLSCVLQAAGCAQAPTVNRPVETAAPQPPQQEEIAPAPPGVIRIDVRDGGLFGELYVPAHRKPLPVLVALGGAEGGISIVSQTSASFSKNGFAVLALAYWGEPGLPQTLEGVPLEYFGKAISWLKQRPDIDPTRIGLIGWSRGAEAALLLASREPDIHAVVAVAPSSYAWAGMNFTRPPGAAWTEAGIPIPYVNPAPPAGFRRDTPVQVLLDAYQEQASQRPDAAIPVERINGPILLLSGDDDRLSSSGEMAEQIVARLKRANFPHAFRHLGYPGAGHVVFVGDPAGWSGEKAASTIGPMVGGSLAANMAAWNDGWPKVLQFLDNALK